MERRYRLRGRTCFLAVREHGSRWVHPSLVLGGLPNQMDTTRCGFIVSSKLGPAVVRNRLRRRLREAVRLYDRHISPGWDLVWIARPPLLEADFRAIAAAVQELLRRADLWQTPQGSEHA